jgi:hypothetical protein
MSDYIGEEVEVVGYWDGTFGWPRFSHLENAPGIGRDGIPLMSVTQHQRIVEGLNTVIDRKNRRISDLANEVVALACENDKLREALELLISTHEEGGWPSAAIVIAKAALAATQEKTE